MSYTLTKDKIQDFFDICSKILASLASVAVPLIIFYFGSRIQTETASINQKLDWKKHDLSIMQEFQTIYFDKDKRGLSLRYVNLIKDPNTKKQLRGFINWDILYGNLAIPNHCTNQSFKFDSTNLDWHWLGENVVASFSEDSKNIDSYLATRTQSFVDFKDCASPDQIKSVFDWIENNYNFARFLNNK